MAAMEITEWVLGIGSNTLVSFCGLIGVNKMTVTIQIFQVGEKSFKHVMNTRHDSVELRDENDEILLNYGADARVTHQDGRMGHFYFEYLGGQPRWVSDEMPLDTHIVYGPDLPTAEVDVSKRYIGQLVSVATGIGQVDARALV